MRTLSTERYTFIVYFTKILLLPIIITSSILMETVASFKEFLKFFIEV